MAALSTSEAVGDAAEVALIALAIPRPDGTGPLPIARRKSPSVPEGETKGLPQLVISVGEEGRVEYLTATQKLKTYPVAVTIVTAGGAKAADDPVVRKWREQVEQKLEARATWAGLAGWNAVAITNKAPFDVTALSKDYCYATVVAEVEVIEART